MDLSQKKQIIYVIIALIIFGVGGLRMLYHIVLKFTLDKGGLIAIMEVLNPLSVLRSRTTAVFNYDIIALSCAPMYL